MDVPKTNIILNCDFSDGLASWHPNACNAFVCDASKSLEGMKGEAGERFTVLKNRTQCWQGLEQDITSRLLPNVTYKVSAWVRIWGTQQISDKVQATLKLEDWHMSPAFQYVTSSAVSSEQWGKLEGTFSLNKLPNKVTFYLEGPSAGTDLLIKRVHVFPATGFDEEVCDRKSSNMTENIIINPTFNVGLRGWHANSCDASVCQELSGDSVQESKPYVILTNRTASWQGLEQDIACRLKPKVQYKIESHVCVQGPTLSTELVLATLRLEDEKRSPNFVSIATVNTMVGKWNSLEGTFTLDEIPMKAVFYLEGPPPGFSLLVKDVKVCPEDVEVCPADRCEFSPSLEINEKMPNRSLKVVCMPRIIIYTLLALLLNLLYTIVTVLLKIKTSIVTFLCSFTKGDGQICFRDEYDSAIRNPRFDDGLNHWSGNNCKIMLREVTKGEALPSGSQHYAIATERTQTWNGIQQDITGRTQRKSAYEVMALVRISENLESSLVLATLHIQSKDMHEQYITMGRVQASSKDWVKLQGRFLVNPEPVKAVAYLEGPPSGVDVLVCSFTIHPAKRAPPSPAPVIENPGYGVNILENSDLLDGTKGWFPLGSCSISVAKGSPHIIPPTAQESLGCTNSLSGNFIVTNNRTQTWEGPAQMITNKLELYVTYQVSAWVRVSSVKNGVQRVNIAINVNKEWNNGGEVEADEHTWKEVAGSFRLEKRPSEAMVYVQGPSSGVDLMVAGLQIFPVDRKARFAYLKKRTEKIRMRDVILKLSGSKPLKWCLPIKVTQTNRHFPLGSCINRSSLYNEDFVAFFVKHFNWAVFGNELKWTWTESQRGQYNYRDADELLEFCKHHRIKVRGHCIFWEDNDAVQQWVKDLDQDELRKAIQNRLNSLLSRYCGKLQHYDVNNEMLHGSFYKEKLGKEIWSYMFKLAHQLDPSATLFVNDYHVEDGSDARSSAERYTGQIVDLQMRNAPVGGIGIQGHITFPIGSIVYNSLNKLASLGLPIWFTEVDVSSLNECLRADDLEVMLRESFAHPAVEGIMLWGFWDLTMSRDHAQLVEADGTLNEAGRRFIALKNEWTTNLHGHSDLEGCFKFRAFHGTYEVQVSTFFETVKYNFTVDGDDSPLVIEINL